MKSSTFILVVIFIELDIKWARDQQVYRSPLNTHLSWLAHMSKKHCVLKLKLNSSPRTQVHTKGLGSSTIQPRSIGQREQSQTKGRRNRDRASDFSNLLRCIYHHSRDNALLKVN